MFTFISLIFPLPGTAPSPLNQQVRKLELSNANPQALWALSIGSRAQIDVVGISEVLSNPLIEQVRPNLFWSQAAIEGDNPKDE